MLSSLSSAISRTPSAPSAAGDGLARVIDLTQHRARRDVDLPDRPLYITPELLAALDGSWSGRD